MTNKCDSISCEERKQGANEYCEKICDNSSILHACNTAVENGENNLNNKSVDSYSNKMKLSDTIEDRPQQNASSASDIVMSSISKQQITEIIDKPADISDKKSQCKPLSKSDSGFSEKRFRRQGARFLSLTGPEYVSQVGPPKKDFKQDAEIKIENTRTASIFSQGGRRPGWAE